MRRKGRKLVRMVSALLGKEKRGPSAQREGKETEVAGSRRATLGAAAGRSTGMGEGPQTPGPITGSQGFGELPGNAQAGSGRKWPIGFRP